MLQHKTRTAPEYIYPVDEWRVVEKRFAPRFIEQTETIFALANGYLGMRGSFEEGRPVYQSGTFVNGFHETWPIPYGEMAYGFATTGQTMLNVADAKLIKLYVDDEPFVLDFAHLHDFERVLDMRRGILERTILWETPAGKRVEIKSTRLVSLEHRHLAAVDYTVTVLDDSAPLVLACEMIVPFGTQSQEGDPRSSRSFEERVLLAEEQRDDGDRQILGHRTRNSGMALACGVDHVVTTDCDYAAESGGDDDAATRIYSIQARPGCPFRVTKYLAYHSSHTTTVDDLCERTRRTLERARSEGWETLLQSQQRRVDDFWRRSDVQIRGDARLQQGVRWNLFQLLQASARVEGAGIGARGLTGQTYEGHYFWDTEIYVLPFLVFTAPRQARNLLRFRYGMLDAARRRAAEVGEQGALFPWRTITGEEASAYYAAGTAQYHINADIVYAMRKYVEVTGDVEFLREYGAEILVETARMWTGLGFYSERNGRRFCIHAVTGPDEYNTVVNNNTFTNLMARENLRYAAATMKRLRDEAPEAYAAVVDRTRYREIEAEDWQRAADAMYVPHDEKLGIHPQDDNFLEKQIWDFKNTPRKNYPLLLHYHPLVIYRHRVLKQADVVMALFLLGKDFTHDEKRRDFDFYDPLTTGDSSLSVCIQSIIASEIGYTEEAYEYFRYAVQMDLANIGGNVRDGAHIAAIGGTWMTLTYGFGGLRDHGGEISFDPHLPVQWEGMSFPVAVRGSEIAVDLDHEKATYTLLAGPELTIRHQGRELTLKEGKPVSATVERAAPEVVATVGENLPREKYDAVLFDMDGVLTATAEVHAEAWKRTFDAYLQERSDRTGEPFRPFEIGADYLLHVDGKPRQDGVRDFLHSRGIQVPDGTPDAPPGADSIWGIGNRKNELINTIIREEGVRAYDGSVRVVNDLRRRGVRMAVVTSSTNGEKTLAAAGIRDLFDIMVDGNVARDEKLAGKPAPDTYLHAARLLDVDPARTVVVEDAISGVQAGRAGDFGLVLGVARGSNAEELLRNGADLVVSDLGELLPEGGAGD